MLLIMTLFLKAQTVIADAQTMYIYMHIYI